MKYPHLHIILVHMKYGMKGRKCYIKEDQNTKWPDNADELERQASTCARCVLEQIGAGSQDGEEDEYEWAERTGVLPLQQWANEAYDVKEHHYFYYPR